jgi:hypothetical protein
MDNLQSFSQLTPSVDFKKTINTEPVRVETAAKQVQLDVDAKNKTYSAGQTISFELPSNTNVMADMERSFVVFDYLISDNATGGNKTLTIADGGQSFFQSVEVFFNNVSVHKTDEYNVLTANLNSVNLNTEARRALETYGGYGQSTRGNTTSYSTRTVAVPLSLDPVFSKTSRLLPLFLLSNVEVRIKLSDAHMVLVKGADGGQPTAAGSTYQISNPVMRIFGSQPNDVDKNVISQKFIKEGLMIPTHAFEHYSCNWAGNVNASVSIDTRKQSVKSVYVVCRKNDNLNSSKLAYVAATGTPDGTFDVALTGGNKLCSTDGRIKQYYFQIGSERYPSNYEINTREAAAVELHNAHSGSILGYRMVPEYWGSTTGNSSFFVGKDFETSHSGNLIAGLANASKMKADIKLRITDIYGSVVNDLRVDAWVLYDKVISVSPRGGVKVIE